MHIGELSLSGQIRPVSHVLRRITEFTNSGITSIILSKNNINEMSIQDVATTLIPITSIVELTKLLLPQ